MKKGRKENKGLERERQRNKTGSLDLVNFAPENNMPLDF